MASDADKVKASSRRLCAVLSLVIGWAIVALSGCSSSSVSGDPADWQQREATVRENMRRVQLAAERYAADHGHNHYPTSIDSEFKTYLPGGVPGSTATPVGPANPFTGENEFPALGKIQDATATAHGARFAIAPGRIEYTPLRAGSGYAIVGGAHDGKALMDINNPDCVLVFSNGGDAAAEQPDVSPTASDAMGHPRLIAADASLPVSGTATPSFKSLDSDILSLMRRFDVPGATVAVAYKGQMLYQRGFGWSDLHARQAMQPESLFRIASVTKALTALAVMKLVEQHKLGLGDSVFSLLPYNKLPHEHRDPRLGNITVQQLLESTAGWNRQRGGDPLFAPYICEAADQYSNSLRPQPDAIARMWLEHDLDFDPGTHFNYSNFSYLLLGRLVEQVSGQRFAAFVHQAVLVPAEATGMQPGRTCARCANEVVHYPFAQQESGASVFPNYKGMVPLTYGGNFSLEAMVADTGWLSSAPDLVRLFSAVFDRHAVVSPATLEMMLARPQVPEWRNAPEYFGMGFEVVAPGKHPRIEYRQGSLPGTTAVVAHRDDGWTWCFLLNTRPADGYSCQMEFTRLLWATVNAFPRHFHNS